MNGVFVDTVALLALWDTRDQWHELAETAFIRTYEQGWLLFTTPQILMECGNALARRPDRRLVLEFRTEMLRSGQMLDPTPGELEAAWSAYARHEAADAGIVDLISFEVMRRMGLTSALTNDEHLRAAGFETLM